MQVVRGSILEPGFASAGFLMWARIANMVVGLATIPVLIHFLGGNDFAAWALLLAVSVVFSALEVGMALTFVRHAAPLIHKGDWSKVSGLLNHTTMILALAFAAATPVVFGAADPSARLLRLPDGQWMSAGQMVVGVFVSVALRGLLQFGLHLYNSARRYRALALASFLQSFASNGAAGLAAIMTGQLDMTLAAYWATQLVVTAAAWLNARRLWVDANQPVRLDAGMLKELFSHGLQIQIYEWAQIVTFQFDKLLIAAAVGLWGVAPYEVANRSVQALRSIPASGIDSFLATAAIGRESGGNVWWRYRVMTWLAAIGVLVFMIAPLAVAPAFLYAWTGEMGYAARWVFFGLLLGAAANVLALPAAAMAQAAGRAGSQARSAVVSMLVNIPLSLVLALQWGIVGAAVGTAVATTCGAALLLHAVHREYRQPVLETAKDVAQLWPLLVVCLCCAAVVHLLFERWLASIDAATRFAPGPRVALAAISGAVYMLCLGVMTVVLFRRVALPRELDDLLRECFPFRRLAAYLAGKSHKDG